MTQENKINFDELGGFPLPFISGLILVIGTGVILNYVSFDEYIFYGAFLLASAGLAALTISALMKTSSHFIENFFDIFIEIGISGITIYYFQIFKKLALANSTDLPIVIKIVFSIFFIIGIILLFITIRTDIIRSRRQ